MPTEGYKEAGLRIGAILKRNRLERGLTLEALAKQVGVSRYTLGQVESGTANPTLSMVWKIANGLSIPVSSLLSEGNEITVKRSESFLKVSSSNRAFSVSPVFTSKRQAVLDTYLASIKAKSEYESKPHNPGVTELVTVIKGSVEIEIDGTIYALEKLDSIQFKGDRTHIYRNTGNKTAHLHFVILYEGLAEEASILFD